MKKLFIMLAAALLVVLFAAGCTSQAQIVKKSKEANQTSGLEAFAKCLTEKGAIMYGAEWCGHCQNQKKEFGDAVQYINFVDCDINKDECAQAGIRGYPTWVINGENYPGERELDQLASLSGCDL